MPTTQKERGTAFHEASHAVAAHRSGMKLGTVTIVRDGATLGSCAASGGGVMAKAIFQIAGSVGEQKFCDATGCTSAFNYSADFDGLEAAVGALAPNVKGSRARGELLDDPIVQAVILDAKILIKQHWGDITALAHALMANGTMSGTAVHSLLINRDLQRPESFDQKAERIRHERDELTRRYGGKNKAANNSGEILLYDEIGAAGITAKMFAEELAGLGDVSEITLGINSPGGDAFDGLAVFNQLISHPAKVNVRIDGLAASAASLIAMAGDRITMAADSFMMLHAPWALSAGNGRDHHEVGDLLNSLTDSFIDIYASRRNLNRAEVEQRVWRETWMDGANAVAAGFADAVIATPALAASVAKGRYNHTPAALLSSFRWSGPPPRSRTAPRWRVAAAQRERDMRLAAA